MSYDSLFSGCVVSCGVAEIVWSALSGRSSLEHVVQFFFCEHV